MGGARFRFFFFCQKSQLCIFFSPKKKPNFDFGILNVILRGRLGTFFRIGAFSSEFVFYFSSI